MNQKNDLLLLKLTHEMIDVIDQKKKTEGRLKSHFIRNTHKHCI
jgi:hypothetical protein